jgi:hypothetical protein
LENLVHDVVLVGLGKVENLKASATNSVGYYDMRNNNYGLMKSAQYY